MEKEELHELYKSWFRRVDKTNPVGIVELITEIINSELCEEQKLYVLGVIMMQNKEEYICKLKLDKKKLEGELKSLKNNYEMLKKKQGPKKVKVVIKKKKSVYGQPQENRMNS